MTRRSTRKPKDLIFIYVLVVDQRAVAGREAVAVAVGLFSTSVTSL